MTGAAPTVFGHDERVRLGGQPIGVFTGDDRCAPPTFLVQFVGFGERNRVPRMTLP